MSLSWRYIFTGWHIRLWQTSHWHQNNSSVLVWGPCTKMELLLWCEREVRHNLLCHPVHETYLMTLTSWKIILSISPSWSWRYLPPVKDIWPLRLPFLGTESAVWSKPIINWVRDFIICTTKNVNIGLIAYVSSNVGIRLDSGLCKIRLCQFIPFVHYIFSKQNRTPYIRNAVYLILCQLLIVSIFWWAHRVH